MSDCACNHFPNTLGNVTFDAGVSVGVGTANPGAPLEVDGSNELVRLVASAGGVCYLTLRAGTSQYGEVGIGSDGSIFTGALPNSLAVRAETSLHLGSGGDGLTVTVTGGAAPTCRASWGSGRQRPATRWTSRAWTRRARASAWEPAASRSSRLLSARPRGSS